MYAHQSRQISHRQVIYRVGCLMWVIGAITVFAVTPEMQEKQVVSPGFLRDVPITDSVSAIVFDAFHTSAPAHEAATVPTPFVPSDPAIYPDEFRTIDGSGNAPGDLGMAGTVDLRNVTIGYGDGMGTPAGADRLGAREISNIVCAQADSIPNSVNVSSFVWNWGNIVDHDMVLTRTDGRGDAFNIPVPQCDPVFDPRCTGTKILDFQRSTFSIVDSIREQINSNTAFLDASFIYGSDVFRAQTLRTHEGGHLAISDGNLMPFNVTGLPNQPGNGNPADFFLGGDVRANENLALATIQTLFVREHNYWADTLAAGDPTLRDNDLYLRARAIVNAEEQLITYRDFIPILLGPDALTAYTGYNSAVDPRVSVAFSTAAFRVGHTFLPPVISRLNKQLVSVGDVDLSGALFAPQLISRSGIEPYLRGLAYQIPQEVDGYIINEVRNFQVGGVRTAGGFDLAALNIQRGRDHGLPSYNQVRIDYGLTPKASFADMTSNVEIQALLAEAYTSPDDMDLWVGGLCEDHYNGGLVGETFFTILKEQFERTRDGDRFWYESYLDPTTLATVQAQTLATIIKRNAAIRAELQDDVFHVPQ